MVNVSNFTDTVNSYFFVCREIHQTLLKKKNSTCEFLIILASIRQYTQKYLSYLCIKHVGCFVPVM